ncbi:MAG: tRNA (adenosine(37)-N6)-dimethylallyltransferase MiaA [Marinilabiliales bacterium]|nr:MAG: tRNA (adenosine(37)-N6)-dimethylallyltransferase MiaA [Marinilabiliales bacterium]
MNRLICILGPTASGKTTLAANLAALIKGEIISADSRQVYKGMDIGTGKDLEDYTVGSIKIPYHLIDIKEPGYEYNVYEFQNDFIDAFKLIEKNDNIPILCGGSGMYLDSIIRSYEMTKANINYEFRNSLDGKSDDDLINLLKERVPLHNTSDTSSRERIIRALEIANAKEDNTQKLSFLKSIKSVNFGVLFDRQTIRERITDRLQSRLDNGMLDEIENLLNQGIKKDELIFYGLEYKYLTLHVLGKLTFAEMFDQLNTAIHQFAKRQMTWYRRMEKKGVHIHWIDGHLSTDEKLALILNVVSKTY